MLFTFFIVVHRFPILYYFQQYRAWMVRRSIQDECYFLFVVLASFHSHNLHFRPKSPIQLMIWHHFEYFPGRIVIKDAKQEAVLTNCLQNCMPCRICDPCIIISFTGLIFLQKPYTFVIFDNFQQYRGVDRHTGRQIRSSILQVPVEKRAVSYLWSFYRYFHHNLIFRPKSPYWVMILLHPRFAPSYFPKRSSSERY